MKVLGTLTFGDGLCSVGASESLEGVSVFYISFYVLIYIYMSTCSYIHLFFFMRRD